MKPQRSEGSPPNWVLFFLQAFPWNSGDPSSAAKPHSGWQTILYAKQYPIPKGGDDMNKAELSQVLAEKLNVSKREAEDMLNTFVEVVTMTLQKGDEVVLTGFGAFSAKLRAARTGVNPQNPTQKIQIAAVKVPKFKAGKALKDALKQ